VGTSPTPAGDLLRALVAEQASGLAADALTNGGQVPAERLDALARLSKLADLRDATTRRAERRWPIVLVAAGTVACVSVLLFARVKSTEVELDLQVSELSFIVPAAQVITDAMSVGTLGLEGLSAAELPAARPGPGRPQEAALVRLVAEQDGARHGSVSLDPIAVPARTRVSLVQGQGVRRYRLGLRGGMPDLAASLQGPVRIVLPGEVNDVRDFPFPRRVGFTPDSQEVTLDFGGGDGTGALQPFRPPVPVESLSLFRIDQFQTAGGLLAPRVSTIRSGTVFFESVDGHARPLRPGEGLNLPRSRGEIRELRLDDSAVAVRFHGTVWDMSVGSAGGRRSLMPTLFEWLSARHGLSLLWGAAAYMIGLFTALAGWWRRAQ
jgi:hypothetical protein